MRKNLLFIPVALLFLLSGCAMMQSVIKSTFPYTTTLSIPRNAQVDTALSVTETANSFDQDFSKSGNNANNVSAVRMVSAKLQSRNPSDFNIGNLRSVKIYMSKADGKDEVMIASRTDITAGVGNTIILDIDNSNFLDEYVREKEVKIRMVYVLRNHIDVKANLHLVLGLGAYPNK